MKQLLCPLNGLRNISEFQYGGEVHAMPEPSTATSRQWVEYVYFHDNLAQQTLEWWCHLATSYWFIAQRDTVTDVVVRTLDPSEMFFDRVDFNDRDAQDSDGVKQ